MNKSKKQKADFRIYYTWPIENVMKGIKLKFFQVKYAPQA